MRYLLYFMVIFGLACQPLPPEVKFIDQNKITGKIVLDDSLKGKCGGDLFIIVRKGISPQPLAVKKVKNPKYPYEFKITPADVITEDMFKEFKDEVILYVKTSQSGNPMESSQSCESEPIIVKTGTQNVLIKITKYLE
ncbi:hypothetical protein [Sulfurihydrogenibium sp.]|uniref:c-type cytochrome biogenesis protein CcmI/CycH n=1 Tax=Sulfurihydrogenibium sp. TaxID=2053621 RepID=UPI0026274E11|nr:hypothetical protein [Sulfurihydrogenibium sp.]